MYTYLNIKYRSNTQSDTVFEYSKFHLFKIEERIAYKRWRMHLFNKIKKIISFKSCKRFSLKYMKEYLRSYEKV